MGRQRRTPYGDPKPRRILYWAIAIAVVIHALAAAAVMVGPLVTGHPCREVKLWGDLKDAVHEDSRYEASGCS